MDLRRWLQWLHRPSARLVAPFLAWARERAIVFDHWPSAMAATDLLSGLDALLEGKRIVFLGEEDHWIHEKSDYRGLLLRYLISRGWRYIGEELGLSDGLRVDRYLQTGEEHYLDEVATYGYRGDIRADRDDRATGLLGSSQGQYPTTEFRCEQLRLLRDLRGISQQLLTDRDQLHYFGFDLDVLAGGGYCDIEQMLEPVARDPLVLALLARLHRVPGETLAQEIARLDDLSGSTLTDALPDLLGSQQCGQLRQWTQTLRDSLYFKQLANPATRYEDLSTAMAMREESMCRQVEHVLGCLGPDDRIVLMGHNRHLSKDIWSIKQTGGAGPGGGLVPSLGTHLHQRFPGQVLSIWQMHARGRGLQPMPELAQDYISPPGTLNAILEQVAPVFLLPTAGAELLQRELNIVGIYNSPYRARVARQADAIFFIREVSPIRCQ